LQISPNLGKLRWVQELYVPLNRWDIMSLGINKSNIWCTVVKYSAYLAVRVNADEWSVLCLIGLLISHVLEMLRLCFSSAVDYHGMRFVVRVSHSNKIPDYKVDSVQTMRVYVKVEVYLHSFLISALGWRWVIWLTPWSPYPRGKSRGYNLKMKLVEPQGLVFMLMRRDKSLAPVGVRNLDRPGGNIVTIGYRLSYPRLPNFR
jgi:hypothetical protein